MATRHVDQIVTITREYYDGPADEIYRSVWQDNIHLGVPCSELCPHPEAMEHTNQIMAERIGLNKTSKVLDLGCGYGSTARYLAANYGCQVAGTNISFKELELANQRAKQRGLGHLLSFEYGDFHDIDFDDETFDVVWSQEAFLHGADKKRILSECHRVLVPDGILIFTDILVRKDTPKKDRERIYDRIKSPDMWDLDDYTQAIKELDFDLKEVTDWSKYVARSYAWVRDGVIKNRGALVSRTGRATVDKTIDALEFWVDSANTGKIGWALFVAEKPR